MRTDLRHLTIRHKSGLRCYRPEIEFLEERVALSATAETPLLSVQATSASMPGISGGFALFPSDFFDSVRHGVLVTATQIITASDTIPRFAAQPTITNLSGGDWSDPSIWSLARVPTSSDRVVIAPQTVVTYSAFSSDRLDALEISGSLVFSTTSNTRLTAANLTVMPEGTLQVGTEASPVSPQVRAEIVIADQPLDLALDPRQFSTGLIGLGTVTIHGAVLSQTWSRLAAEPRAGDTSLLVTGDLSGWRPGDTLVLPDTRQVRTSDADRFLADELAPEWEEVTIERIETDRVFLNRALEFDHLGARNASGAVELLPHVASLNRNVILRSENPAGTRGHTFFTSRAAVDIRYARFQNLGRTDAFRPLDSTKFDAAGAVTHLGTNQVGRYAVHLHHLLGPENPTNTGYQFKFVGNTVERSRKWAVAVHDTSFGLLKSNVVYDAQGAGFVTEDGSEINNLFHSNITIRIQGTHVDGKAGTLENDYGRGGSGFWFRRAGNQVVGNVAADSTYAGFVIDGYSDLDPVRLPRFRGADKFVPGQGWLVGTSPSGLFVRNEAYGMSEHGLWMAFPRGDDLIDTASSMTIYGLRLWNIHHAAVAAYHTSAVNFNQLLILGDSFANNRNDTGPYGMDLKAYENRRLAIRNARIEGVYFGIYAPKNDASEAGIERPTVIEDTSLKNYINLLVSPAASNRPGNGNALVVRNVKFELTPNLATGPAPPAAVLPAANIYMFAATEYADLTQRSIVRVYNYNQAPGDDFQVFYREQSPTFVMPQTDPSLLSERAEGLIGSPVVGMTNQWNWQAYGIATAGGLLPAEARQREAINGLVAPIQDISSMTPRVVIVTPWAGAQVEGNQPVRVRYNVNGDLPAGASIYFSVDGGLPFNTLYDGGIYNLSAGLHILRAYIGDANGQSLPGTWGAVRFFTVHLPAADSSPDETAGSGGLVAAPQLAAVASALAVSSDADAEFAGGSTSLNLNVRGAPSNRTLVLNVGVARKTGIVLTIGPYFASAAPLS